jgi:putative endonuclease
MPSLFKPMNKREFGGQLETFACDRLKQKGCRIVAVNFECKLGEIDIIAEDDATLVFVEVRYRKQNKFGGAIESVDFKKQSKIIKTAQFYLQQRQLTNKVACRFDVIALEGDPQRLAFNWIKSAFTA